MNQLFKFFISLCLLGGLNTFSYAQEKYNETRGQLLYSTHCNACHDTQIHWREQKLVKDWETLQAQVRRWQYISGLGWNADEITDVTYHLDKLYYRYKNTAHDK